MITRGCFGSCSGSGSGSNSGTKLIDERLGEFISAEVTCDILGATLVMLGTIKEWIIELMDERLRSFQTKIVAGQIGPRTPSFREFKVSEALEFFGIKDPIASWRWINGMKNAQRTIFGPEGENMGSASYLLRDRACVLREVVTLAIGLATVEVMT